MFLKAMELYIFLTNAVYYAVIYKITKKNIHSIIKNEIIRRFFE